MSLDPAIPLSELEDPVILRAVPAPAVAGEAPHLAGPEIVSTSTAIRLALQQFGLAQTRGQWSQATADLAEEITYAIGSIHASLAHLAHLAATNNGGPL